MVVACTEASNFQPVEVLDGLGCIAVPALVGELTYSVGTCSVECAVFGLDDDVSQAGADLGNWRIKLHNLSGFIKLIAEGSAQAVTIVPPSKQPTCFGFDMRGEPRQYLADDSIEHG